MLMKRVIPCLDVDRGRVVKGVNFVDLREAGDPVELARFYDAEGADELVFLDITASHEDRPTMLDVASRTAEEVFIPYTVGGGMRSADDIRAMLAAGSDKISMNSAAVRTPALIGETSRIYGAQCIVVAVDARRVSGDRDRWEVFINGGRINTGLDALEWVAEAERRGAGEILLTSMDRDGTNEGYDLPLTRAVARGVNIPVIASGGAGTVEHFSEVVLEADADAVLAASTLHYGLFRVRDIKQHMHDAGIAVRMVDVPDVPERAAPLTWKTDG
jgi:imidazole glycerol-phosphate synthase subunit HisF